MHKLQSLAALLAASVALAAAAPAVAAPVTVNLRVEGSSQTFYEGPVTTDAKTLTKDSSGAHPCDGTNGGANPTPGPTMTGALDDGTIAGGLTWDRTRFNRFEGFGLKPVGPHASTSTAVWGYGPNFRPTQG